MEAAVEKEDTVANVDSNTSSPLKQSSHSRGLDEGKTIAILNRPRTTILVILGLTILVLILNIVFISWASANSTQGYGDSIIYRGSCTHVKNLKLWLHLLINVLSTVLVTGSSYCIQSLNAPKREEVDAAHSKGQSCRIGVIDLSNLFRISWTKRLTIFGLSFSSLTIHVIYNATIVNSIATTSYHTLGVRPSFLNSASFDLGPFTSAPPGAANEVLSIQANLSNFERLDNRDCITAYLNPLVTDRGDLLLVLDDSEIPTSGSTNNSILTWNNPCFDCAYSYDWLCTGLVPNFFENNSTSHPVRCTEPLVRRNLEHAGNWTDTGGLLGGRQAVIQYCLSQKTPERCTLEYSRDLLIVTIVWNAVKVGCMIIAALECGHTLMTVGDAIYSFLEHPDSAGTPRPSKEEAEQTSSSTIDKLTSRFATDAQKTLQDATYGLQHPPKRGYRFWFESCTKTRYCLLAAISLIVIGLGAGFIGKTTANVAAKAYPSNFGHLVTLGFGSISGYELLHVSSTGVVGNSVIANLPQLMISVLYYILNGVLSCQLAEREWSRFGTQRRRIRTSFPSTEDMAFYLSMPYSYSGPLIVMFIGLHLSVSQSLFGVEINFYTWDGSIAKGLETTYNAVKVNQEGATFSTLCASTCAAIFSMMAFGIIIVVVVANSFRRMTTAMPFPGTHSIVIAATTHSKTDIDQILGKTIMWTKADANSDNDAKYLGTFETE